MGCSSVASERHPPIGDTLHALAPWQGASALASDVRAFARRPERWAAAHPVDITWLSGWPNSAANARLPARGFPRPFTTEILTSLCRGILAFIPAKYLTLRPPLEHTAVGKVDARPTVKLLRGPMCVQFLRCRAGGRGAVCGGGVYFLAPETGI